MRKEAWLQHNSARFIYYSYKDSPYFHIVTIMLIILVSFLLIAFIFIPQTQNWFSIRDEAIAARQRIDIIKGNIAFMTNFNKKALEDNRQTVISALPVEKDFGSIINAIALSSARSGVSVDDFVFSVGSVSSASAAKQVLSNSLDTTTLLLSLRGNIDDIIAFIKEVGEKLPLSEVESVDIGKGAVSLSMVFYSKPYRLIKVQADKTINPVSTSARSIISTLSQWQADSNSFLEAPPIRSPQTPLF